jgi:DnaK suppressor protein
MTTRTTSPQQALDDLHALLTSAEQARQRQLDALPHTTEDLVARAHRASVVRILDDIRAAQRRLADGRYGACSTCEQPIAPERLELRPWAPTCTRCSERTSQS